jgi:GrpB-like predicted nucleotidyltransferase (UPF0157 family)
MKRIEIVAYDPCWPAKFQAHADAIAAALGDIALRIEHVGSTAVPELAAKPIVDIFVVVPDSGEEEAYRPRMEKAGYELRVREPEFHQHRMFRTPQQDVHVHLFSAGSSEVDRLLMFRDRLRRNSGLRQLYGAKKRELAALPWQDMDAYARAKKEIVETILASINEEAA